MRCGLFFLDIDFSIVIVFFWLWVKRLFSLWLIWCVKKMVKVCLVVIFNFCRELLSDWRYYCFVVDVLRLMKFELWLCVVICWSVIIVVILGFFDLRKFGFWVILVKMVVVVEIFCLGYVFFIRDVLLVYE